MLGSVKRRSLARRLLGKSAKEPGAPPGSLVHVGDTLTEKPTLWAVRYRDGEFQEVQDASQQVCETARDGPGVKWINLDGLHETSLVESLAQSYGIHALVAEDILNTSHRPKFEEYDGYAYMVLRVLYWQTDTGTVAQEQLSVVLGREFVLTFQERASGVLAPVLERVRHARGRIRSRGADYLAYAIVDAVVDQYFAVLQKVGEEIEAVEEGMLSGPSPEALHKLHELNRECLAVRKAVWPLREMLSSLSRGETPAFSAETIVFLRDVYDHVIEIVETVEALRDLLTSLLDTYLSLASNAMNEVMKVLTIIATLFIPVTFVAGVYGMNFPNMPEMRWPYAYPAVLIVMLGSFGAMLAYFKRRKWL